MVDSTNGMSAADVAAVVGNNRNNGDGFFGGEGGYLLLFLVLLMSGGLWGGAGFGGMGMGGYGMWNMGMAPYFYNSQTQNEVARGFDNSAVNAALTAISAAVNGIGNQLCNGLGGVNQNVSNGFANAEIAANNRQMAAMQQGFTAQTAISGQLNGIGMNQQSAIYENRQNIADVKYTIAQENCLDRQVLSDGVRDIIANQNAGFQSIRDMYYNGRMDDKNEKIADLERQLTMANLAASQSQQTAEIKLGQISAVDSVYQRMRDCPVPSMPVYGSQPIFTCPNNGYNYVGGCNG